MCKNVRKRGYNFPIKLIELWEHFHRPSKDYSPSAAAAFVLYMACNAQIREKLRKLAFEDVDKAILLAKSIVKEPNQSA